MTAKQTPTSASSSHAHEGARPVPSTSDIHLTACPQCGAPAEMINHATLTSTDGPVDMVRINCVARHWFLIAAGTLS